MRKTKRAACSGLGKVHRTQVSSGSQPRRAPLVRLTPARVWGGKALCLCAAWKQEEIVKCAPANRSACAPFGTLLSVKELNYPECKKKKKTLQEPPNHSSQPPACISFVQTKH